MPRFDLKTWARAGLATLLAMAVAACFVSPGKFAETLDLRKDGRFTYTYKGEIWVLGLTKLAQMAEAEKNTFKPNPCYNDDTGAERECTKDELASQKAEWEEDRKIAEKSNKDRDAALMAMLGGLDPSDPKAGEELAERLRKQVGWKSVIYKGDGVYEVEFVMSSRLDYDFAFPTMERMQGLTPFITLTRRADGSVRVSSPLFEDQGNTNGQGLGAMAMIGMMGGPGGKDADMAGIPVLDGTFTLTTDGTILANNTLDGPAADTAGQRLTWKLNARNTEAPMALIQLAK